MFCSIESATIETEFSFPAFAASASLTSLARLSRPKVSGAFIVVPRTPIAARRAIFTPLPTATSGSRKKFNVASIVPEMRSAAVLSFSKYA